MSERTIPEGFACTKIHRRTEDSYASVEVRDESVWWEAKHLPSMRYRSGPAPDVHAGVADADEALAWMRENPPAVEGEWSQEFPGAAWEATICCLACSVRESAVDRAWEWTVGYSTSGEEPTREAAQTRAKAVATAIVAPLASVPT